MQNLISHFCTISNNFILAPLKDLQTGLQPPPGLFNLLRTQHGQRIQDINEYFDRSGLLVQVQVLQQHWQDETRVEFLLLFEYAVQDVLVVVIRDHGVCTRGQWQLFYHFRWKLLGYNVV